MIQCPKCNFPQPEDIYCANCGVNMASYAKKKASSIGFLNHWLVQVLLIIVLIVGFVLYDNTLNKKTSQKIATKTIPLPENTPTADTPESLSAPARTAETVAPAAQRSQRTQTQPMMAASASATTAKPSSTANSTAPASQQGLQVSFYKVSRQGLAELQRRSQAVTTAGEAIAGYLPKTRLQPLLSGSEFQYISGNRYKDFDDQPSTMIFKGQRHAEAGRNLGLFFQLTTLRKNETQQTIEIKAWGALKALEPDENFFNGEMTLTPTTVHFVTGFIPKNNTYTEDENQLFESDRLLKELNEEAFTEGVYDIIMLIEFNSTN